MNQGRSRGARVDGCVRTIIIISGNQTLNYGRGRRLRLLRPTTLSSLESIERTRTIIDDRQRTPSLYTRSHRLPSLRATYDQTKGPTSQSSYRAIILAETHSFDPLPFNHLDQSRSSKGSRHISLSPSFPCLLPSSPASGGTRSLPETQDIEDYLYSVSSARRPTRSQSRRAGRRATEVEETEHKLAPQPKS